MIAQIVESVRPVQLQPRSVVLVVSGAQVDGAGRAGGQAARRAAGAVRRRPDSHAGADRQSACGPTDLATAQDGGGGDQAPHRRATGPRTRADVRHPAAGRERRVPPRVRRAAAPDAPRRRTAGPHAGHPAGGAAAQAPRPGEIDLRKTLRKSMSTGGVPIDVVLRKPRPARPELVVLCDVFGFGRRVQPLHAAAGARAAPAVLPGAGIRLHRHHRRGHRSCSAPTPTWPSPCSASPARRASTPATGTPTTATRSCRSWTSTPTCCRRAVRCWCSATAATTTATPRPTCWPTWSTASRHAHWLNPEPQHLWGSGDSAVPRYEDVITMHECRSAKQLAAVIDQLLPV